MRNKKIMKRLIIKSNQWYESLPDMKGSLFYLALIFIPYVILMLTLPKPYYYFSMMWPLLVAIWRFSYQIIKDFGHK
jgi:hypothetical protein